MNRRRGEFMKRIIILVLVLTVIVVAFLPLTASAASRTMKVYDEVLKEGKYVYCISEAGIYKVNVRNGNKKTLEKKDSTYTGTFPEAMKKKGKWLYYMADGPIGTGLYRVNVNNARDVELVEPDGEHWVERYMISGNRIYYTWGSKYRVMKLNGKNKKYTKTKPLMRHYTSNARGYKVINKYYTVGGVDYCISYLKTPSREIYLGKVD